MSLMKALLILSTAISVYTDQCCVKRLFNDRTYLRVTTAESGCVYEEEGFPGHPYNIPGNMSSTCIVDDNHESEKVTKCPMKEIDCVAHNHKNIILSGHRYKWQDCGEFCFQTEECKFWTYSEADEICHILKDECHHDHKPNDKIISGGKHCPIETTGPGETSNACPPNEQCLGVSHNNHCFGKCVYKTSSFDEACFEHASKIHIDECQHSCKNLYYGNREMTEECERCIDDNILHVCQEVSDYIPPQPAGAENSSGRKKRGTTPSCSLWTYGKCAAAAYTDYTKCRNLNPGTTKAVFDAVVKCGFKALEANPKYVPCKACFCKKICSIAGKSSLVCHECNSLVVQQ